MGPRRKTCVSLPCCYGLLGCGVNEVVQKSTFTFSLFSLSTEESSVVLLCMYCWPACKVSSSIRPLVRLFYDCTLSGKALSTGVLPLSVLYRLAKVGLSDEVRAQALVLHLHYSFLREQIPRHVGPFHCASYSFHYRGLARPVESRLGSLGAQASQWTHPYPLSVRRKLW